jgi:2-aminoadipate transaminase
MTTPWERRYAQRTQGMGSSAIRELLKLTENPDVISFAGGLPAAELFPIEMFKTATDKVLTEHGRQALQYGTTEGYRPLREYIVQKMERYGIHATPDNVLITSGSQQALDLLGKLLVNSGDLILTERPTYLGAIQAWRGYKAEFITVPIDDDGLRVDMLEEALTAGPKFMYILPNFQNPGGVTLSLERRRQLIKFADKYGIPIIEDDPYGQLRFEGEHIPPLVVLDGEVMVRKNGHSNGQGFGHGNVIYTSTFSKTLAPGLRLAWLVAPTNVVKQCVMVKQGMDLHTSSFVQMVAYEAIQTGELDAHVRRIRDVYRERRDVMLRAMAEHFPSAVRWTRPQGGLFLWATLPDGMDAAAILPLAVAKQVAFVPGAAFYPNAKPDNTLGRNTMRLNFSNATPEKIEVGIKRLGEVLHQVMEKEGALA